MITRVEIENFRSIIRGKAVITEGINFIHGPNGAGKTSILEAIAIALYGSEWVRGKYRLGDLVRRGASSSVIRLEYVGLDGRRYLIQRAFTTEKSLESQTYVVDEGGKRLAVRDREVTQFVVRTTGIDMETFSELLYVRQGEIREILRTGRKGELRLDTLLKLDAIERARQDVIREGLRTVSGYVEGLRGRLEVLERELSGRKDEIARLEREVSEAMKVLNAKEEELRSIEEEFSRLSARERELRDSETEYLSLKQRLTALAEEEGSIRREISDVESRLRELDGLRSRANELEAAISEEGKLRERLEELLRRREEIRGRLALAQEVRRRVSSLSRELEEVERSFSRLNEELDKINDLKVRAEELRRRLSGRSSLETELEAARNELARVNSEIEHVETEIGLLKSGGERCPLCGRPLSPELAGELIKARELRLGELRRRARELENRVGALTSELEGLRGVEEELRSIEAELGKEGLIRASLEDLRRRRENITSELNSLPSIDESAINRELEELEREVEVVNEALERINKAKMELAEIRGKLESANSLEARLRELEGRLGEVVKARGEAEARVRELEDRVRELVEVRASLEKVSSRRDSLMREVGELKGRVEALRDRIEKLRSEVMGREREISTARSDLARYMGAVDTLSRLQQVLDEVKPTVRRIFLDSVNEEMNAMSKELMHKTSYASVEVDEDYGIVVRRSDGVALPVESLSIGERNLISLMFRYAIARVIMGLVPLLILDEPTEHLDEEHRRRIAGWIRSLSNGVRTVIITSHVDALETIADNVIRVSFINEKGESTFANT